ncbi:VOC family protein [Saccharomonospora piscinae]|uniref:VOC family protein n=1 Tax=Saccharomonospora piscinae TaxID=687388 RepID=UPI000463C2C6|nr:VOC family protein [Saccharomonospora piscinae]
MTLVLENVTIDCADPRSLAEFWTAALDWRVTVDFEGEMLVLSAQDESGTSLSLQRVEEFKQGKNRVHVDLTADDRGAEVARLVGLGATVRSEHEIPGIAWTVLADPEGNEFCIATHG